MFLLIVNLKTKKLSLTIPYLSITSFSCVQHAYASHSYIYEDQPELLFFFLRQKTYFN